MEKYYFNERRIKEGKDLNEKEKLKLKLKCKKISKSHAENLKNEWWSTNYEGDFKPDDKRLFELRNRLLGIGGEEVVLPTIDEDITGILDKGNLWIPDNHNRVKMVLGTPSQCHRNSCDLWDVNKDSFDIKICTGYSLTEDSMWRCHSFLVMINKKTKKAKIVETTAKRIAYYGFVMNDEECEEFYFANY